MSYSLKDILYQEVSLALGCTEPVAVALGSAAAASALAQRRIDTITVWVDPNIYKNGLGVVIPGSGGLKGLDLASALGALTGDPQSKMQVLENVDSTSIRTAQDMVSQGRVTVHLLKDHQGLYIKTQIKAQENTAVSVIQGIHDNIVSVSLNGHNLSGQDEGDHTLSKAPKSTLDIEQWLHQQPLSRLIELVDGLDHEAAQFMLKGIETNSLLAQYGLEHGSGLGVGRTLQDMVHQGKLQEDMILSAKIVTSAAADARMSGAGLPAMSSAGSGNNGLMAILPIWAIRNFVPCQESRLLQGIALSHLITIQIKTYTGRLSSLCSCSVAAGAGAAGGTVYALGGTELEIAGAINNLIADLGGVFCDGAKSGCALKLATAAGSAIQSALLAMQGVIVPYHEGILGHSPEQTLTYLGRLSSQGMQETGTTILDIMLNKRSQG
jgi:L-cysteine desulfidase